MKIADSNFRDLYQRFFAVDDFFSIRRLQKIVDFNNEGIIILYFFVSDGVLSAYFLGNVIKEGYELSFDKDLLDQKIYLPALDIEAVKLKELGDEVRKIKYTDEIIKNTDIDNKYNILKTREMNELDNFRDDFNPDSVLCYMPSTKEKIWVSLLGVQSKGLLISILEEDSAVDTDFTKGDLVGVFYENDKLIIKGRLKKKM